MKKIFSSLGQVPSYIFGILMLLSGITSSDPVITRFCLIMAGLLNLPIIFFTLREYIKRKKGFHLRRLHSFVMVITLVFISILFLNSLNNKSNQKSPENLTNSNEAIKPIVDVSGLLLNDINDIVNKFTGGQLTKNTDIKTSNYTYESNDYNLIFEYQSKETVENSKTEIEAMSDSIKELYKYPDKVTYVQASLKNESCEPSADKDMKPKAKEYLKKVGFDTTKILNETQPMKKNTIRYDYEEKKAVLNFFCSNLGDKPVVKINYSVTLPE